MTTEGIEELKRILNNYSDLFEDGYTEKHVLEAYKFKKPVTGIEFTTKDKRRVKELTNELKEFFFVEYLHIKKQHFILVSRFRYIIRVAKKYIKKCKGCYDKCADILGLIFGYHSEEIPEYCLQERMKKYNLIK